MSTRQCSKCGTAITTKNMARHVKLCGRAKTKPSYDCPLCNKVFNHTIALGHHLVTHIEDISKYDTIQHSIDIIKITTSVNNASLD